MPKVELERPIEEHSVPSRAEIADNEAFYRCSPHLVMEAFGDEALVLVAEQDRFVTINRAAADVMELMRKTFGEQGFAVDDVAALLAGHYALSSIQALREAQTIIEAWLAHGILTPATDVPFAEDHDSGDRED